MQSSKDKMWIALFQHNDRSDLNHALNELIRDNDVYNIHIWIHNNLWCASARYCTLEKEEIQENL